MAHLIRIIDEQTRGTWLLDGTTLIPADDVASHGLRADALTATDALAAADAHRDEDAIAREVRRQWADGFALGHGAEQQVLSAGDPLPPTVRVEVEPVEGPWDADGTWNHLTDWLHDETIVRPELTDDEVEALAAQCQAEELVHGVWLDVEIVARQIRQVRDDRRRELLDAAVEATGLSRRVFAEERMVRDERTIRRWTSGEIPIPDVAVAALRRIVAADA